MSPNRKEPAKSAATAQPRKKSSVQQLLTEIERQEAVFAELPDNCELPLFDGRQAIESQRKRGYKNTALAAREIETDALLEKRQAILTRDFGT